MADSKIDDGGPAYPQNDLSGYGMGPSERDDRYTVEGMSLRDWFAGQALPQAVEDYDRLNRRCNEVTEYVLPYATKATGTREDIIARQAYRYADAMIAARKAGV
jgi:hypothetical protein